MTLFFSYYEYLWLRNKGVDASSMFEGLPLSLQADISLSLYKDMIERVKLLSFMLFYHRRRFLSEWSVTWTPSPMISGSRPVSDHYMDL